MLDLNITLLFQLVNFFIALYVLNLLLIRPIRAIMNARPRWTAWPARRTALRRKLLRA